MKSMKMMKKAQAGFTLIELMIVVAIIGILAAVALPAYSKYMDKAKFSEVMLASQAAKTAVEICAQDQGGLDACDGDAANTQGIPVNIASPAPGKYVDSVTTANGVITVVPKAFGGVTLTETYVISPVIDVNGKVQWTVSGGCIAKQLCKA